MNSNIDTYNNKMKEFCDSTNNVTFLDVTQNINEDNGNGVLKDDFTTDGLHLNGSDKYEIWYDDIISAINGNAGEFELVEFEGYEADEYVVSPVTGKILEVGQHDRMNLYTGQMETVDYVVIEAMNKKDYFTKEMFEKDDFGYETETKFKEPQDALNLFYDEYEDVCEGYTIMIDGFDVDLSLVDGEGDDAKEGEYKQDEDSIMLLWNSSEQEERKKEEQAKDDAPFFVRYGESKDYPEVSDNYKAESGLKGYYVKEGKYLGKTIENSEVLVSNDEDITDGTTTSQDNTAQDTTENTESTTTEKLTYNYNGYEGPADYMRIIIKDTDYAIVDNVEDFFEIPEITGTNNTVGDIDMLAKFTCAFENSALYDYLYGGANNYDNVKNYITEDKKYFLCRGDHYDDDTNRNFGFGVCHHSFGKYMQMEYYEKVGVDIDSGAYYNEGTKLEVEKVEAVRQMIIDNNLKMLQSKIGDSLWNELGTNKQHCLADIAYQCGPNNSNLNQIIIKMKDSGVNSITESSWPFSSSEFKTRQLARKKLWFEGIYTDSSGNEIK